MKTRARFSQNRKFKAGASEGSVEEVEEAGVGGSGESKEEAWGKWRKQR